MLLKSLLFALLLSASSEEPRRLRGASEPRLNGTSSDVSEGNYTNITKRAAVSNQFNPGPRVPRPGASRTLVVFPPRLER